MRLHATRAAAKEGYVPGGGVSFVRAISAVEDARRKGKGDEKLGYDILCRSDAQPDLPDRQQCRHRR